MTRSTTGIFYNACPFTQLGVTVTVPNSMSQSAIGCKFLGVPRTAVAVAVTTVALDFVCVIQNIDGQVRISISLLAFALAVYLSDGDHKSLGLRASPVQGWSCWISMSLKIGCAVAVCIIVGFGLWSMLGNELELAFTQPSQAWSKFILMCFVAPTLEEAVYRFVACGLIAAIVGNKRTIVVNGLLFGILHFLYGNPSPENMIGGFFLAWSYLKSETILMPFLLHSIGNFLALTGQVVGWYILGSIA
ncbi:CPBP family intramembrane metalloprotease [Planctomycetaceae bacterium]|nr:CPBP family intramembrane metalloprotease [Planctomycetaceae bacterium]